MAQAPASIYKIGTGEYYTGVNQRVTDPTTLSGLETGKVPYSTVQKGLEGQFTDPDFFKPKNQAKFSPTVLSPDMANQDFQKKSAEFDKIKSEVNVLSANDNETGLTPEESKALGIDALDSDAKMIDDSYNAYMSQVDARTNDTINQIKSIKQSEIADTREANANIKKAYENFGIRSGLKRYAGESTQAVMNKVEMEGLDRISKINNEEATLINQASTAREDKQFSIFQNKMTELKNIRKEKEAVLSKVRETAIANQKKARESVIQSSRDLAVAGLVGQGITDPVQMIDYLNYDQNGNQIGDFTAEEIKKTLDNLIPGKNTKDLGADAQMYEWAKQNGWIDKNATIFDYWKQEDEAKNPKTGTRIGTGNGQPGDIGDFMFFLSALPTQLKNSDNEKEFLRTYFDDAKTRGLTPFKMIDEVTGYRVEATSAFSEGMRQYALAQDLDSTQIAKVARLINAGQHDQAIQFIENVAYGNMQEQYKDTFVGEGDVIYINDKVDEINKLLGKGWNDEVGAFTGNFNKWLSKKFGWGQATSIKAKITSLTASIINKRAGSALTETEWEKLVSANVPDMNESPVTWKNKMDELTSDAMQRLNSERKAFELPTIDKASLYNRNLRIPAYSSVESFDPTGSKDLRSELDSLVIPDESFWGKA